ncbi:hypothetical protein [Oryza sativa Japonica Group]|uniref:Uncharacterized protein B1003B09.4 n=1 Tax=Oryza sativa subsp. japonica TaxID=39947 RepID=Q5QLK4_ORYSJ|nr:hypothetical protein [Oryza sativa Japonica Group]
MAGFSEGMSGGDVRGYCVSHRGGGDDDGYGDGTIGHTCAWMAAEAVTETTIKALTGRPSLERQR